MAWEIEQLSINVLELAARNIGSFTFLEHARAIDCRITHLCEFTDNRAAEFALEFGKPKAPGMQAAPCSDAAFVLRIIPARRLQLHAAYCKC